MHKFTKPGIKLTKFKKNISSLALYSSYHIFITRNEEHFNQPSFLLPPFESENWIIMKILCTINNVSGFSEKISIPCIAGKIPHGQGAMMYEVWNNFQKNLCVKTGCTTLSWVNTILSIVLAHYLGACDYNYFVCSKFDK